MSSQNHHSFTSTEVARYLNISPVTLWRLRKAGKITFRRVASRVIFVQNDIDAFLEECRRGGNAVISDSEVAK